MVDRVAETLDQVMWSRRREGESDAETRFATRSVLVFCQFPVTIARLNSGIPRRDRAPSPIGVVRLVEREEPAQRGTGACVDEPDVREIPS